MLAVANLISVNNACHQDTLRQARTDPLTPMVFIFTRLNRGAVESQSDPALGQLAVPGSGLRTCAEFRIEPRLNDAPKNQDAIALGLTVWIASVLASCFTIALVSSVIVGGAKNGNAYGEGSSR